MTTNLISLKNRCTNVNIASNNPVNTPYWKILKRYTKQYFIENKISEISVNDFHLLTNLKKDYCKALLTELNAECFNK